MSKFMDRFSDASSKIEPSGERRKTSKPAAPLAFGGVVVARDAALDRAEQAEARVVELENALREAQAKGGALELDLDELHEVRKRHP